MWVARDKDGKLAVFSLKPNRCKYAGWNNDSWDAPDEEENGVVPDFMEINSSLFPNLKWEDEPIEVELVSKNFMDWWRLKNHILNEMSDAASQQECILLTDEETEALDKELFD